tara:strand:- start:808 stop:1767 length:960 start_codon:yes stop_codon:yes gene_type:complete
METTIGIDISKALDLLSNGELVAIPTETVYGLAANIEFERAVAKIFEVKNRPTFDPLIVHLYDKSELEKYCHSIAPEFETLYEAFCPGPLTFILPKRKNISDLITAGQDSIGIRFPKHTLTRDLLKKGKFALAAPSANPFGYVSPTSANHVAHQLGAKIPYILNGGECEVGLESTIIDLSRKKISVLRLGGLSLEEIESVLGFKVEANKTSSSNPKAPGMLSSHYSPSKKIIFNEEINFKEHEDLSKIGAIRFHTPTSALVAENQWVLSEKADLNEAARLLFKVLRETDSTDLKLIYAQKFPEEGLGRAINDRLKRAAY